MAVRGARLVAAGIAAILRHLVGILATAATKGLVLCASVPIDCPAGFGTVLHQVHVRSQAHTTMFAMSDTLQLTVALCVGARWGAAYR